MHRLPAMPVTNYWWRCFGAILFISITFSLTASAQKKVWDKTIGASEDDRLTSLQQTSDGGYLLAGYSNSDINGDKTSDGKNIYKFNDDYWLVKLNADGTKAWDRVYGGNGDDELIEVLRTKDGGYMLGGHSNSKKNGDKTEAKRGSDDYWVIKINADGTKAWDKTIGGSGADNLTSVQQTSDGGYILGGTTSYGNISGDKTEADKGGFDYWVVKLNANGSKAWDKTLGGSGEDRLNSVQQTSDGSYILGGYSSSGKNGDKTQDSYKYEWGTNSDDYWVVKLKPDGSKAWDKTIGASGSDYLTSLQLTSDGGYILGGHSNSDIGGDKSEANKGPKDKYGRLHMDYWVVKLNADGSKAWDKTIGTAKEEYLASLRLTKDGGYILGGTTETVYVVDESEKVKGLLEGPDYWVVKLNADGSKVWDKTVGGSGDDYLSALLVTAGGDYLLGGNSYSDISGDKSEANRGRIDYWVIKLAEKTTQTITFEPIADKTFGAAPFTLSAKASSGLPVTFSVVSGPATIKGNTITLTGIGKVMVKVSQAGNETYAPATATQTFMVLIPSTITWDKTIGGNDNDFFRKVLQTKDGGYILGGSSHSDISGDKSENRRDYDEVWEGDFWVVKLKADGTKEWDKTFGGNYYDFITSIQQTSDGGYILGGSSGSGIYGDKTESNRGGFDEYGKHTSDYWVVKIDAKGNKVWDKTIGGEDSDFLTSIQQTSDGGYILGGASDSGISGDKSEANKGQKDEHGQPTPDYWIVKLDAKGKKLWDKTIGGSAIDELNSIQQTSDGGFILGGSSTSDKGGDKSEASKGAADYWIVKVSANGNKQWDKTIGGSQNDGLATVQQTSDGGYILGGASDSGISGDKSEANKGQKDEHGKPTPDYWIVKLSAEGTKIWDNTIGGNKSDSFTSLQQTKDEGYIVAGFSDSGLSGDKSQASKGGYDYWIVKLKADGSKQWDKTLGGSGNDQLYDVQQTSDDNYILGGTSYSYRVSGDKSEPTKGSSDFWVVKLQVDETPEVAAWDMRYGGAGLDNFTDAIKTSDGGYLAGGYTNSGNSGDKTQSSRGQNDYWIVKSDKNGKKLWDKRYGGSGDDFLNRLIQTSDGGYLLAGSSRSGAEGDKSQQLQGNRDYWVVKVDAQGNKQWDKSFGGNGYDELKKVIQLSSGEYVLGGYSDSPASGDKSQGYQGTNRNNDYWLVKISATGTKIWDKRYGGDQDDNLSSFTITPEGGFLLVGTSYSGATGDKTRAKRGQTDYWVIRTDKDGLLLWDKAYGGSKEEYASSVVQSNGDTYFISGSSDSPADGNKSQPSYKDENGDKTQDYWVIKINGMGKKLWDKTLGGKGFEFLQASTATPDGGLVVAGNSIFSGVSGDKSEADRGDYDYWVVKLDENGAKQWDKTLGGSGKDDLRTVTQTRDGGLLLGGRSASGVSGDRSQPSQGGNDYWLVKLAPETSSMLATREVAPVEVAIAVERLNLQAYPNPFTERATIRFTLPETQAATVKVYDSQGREITTLFQGEALANQTYQVEWQAGKKAGGMYLLQLQTPTTRQQQKLLLVK